MPLPREHFLDELATAYVQVVAAAAGATIAVSRVDYGVDGTLSHVVRAGRTGSPGYRYIPEGFPIDFQLKGTTVATIQMDLVRYDLNARNYDLIVRRPAVATPLYLFLVCFGPEAEDWISVRDDELILSASAYWWKQSGSPTRNASTVRIDIPLASRLTSRAIEDMLASSRNRFGLR
jgi:hypothetical protein